jgi:hypothetical protein
MAALIPLATRLHDQNPRAGGPMLAVVASRLDGVAVMHRTAPLVVGDPVERTGLLVVVLFFLLLVVLVIGAGVMFFDLAGRREEDTAWLQTTIVDGIRRDPSLSDLSIRPVVHAPVGTNATARVELSGAVPSEATRGAVIEIVEHTARKVRRQVEIDDRLAVTGPPVGSAA